MFFITDAIFLPSISLLTGFHHQFAGLNPTCCWYISNSHWLQRSRFTAWRRGAMAPKRGGAMAGTPATLQGRFRWLVVLVFIAKHVNNQPARLRIDLFERYSRQAVLSGLFGKHGQQWAWELVNLGIARYQTNHIRWDQKLFYFINLCWT